MKILGVIGISLLVVLMATGCIRVVDGTMRPAPGMKPRLLGGQAVKQVLLDETQLLKVLGQSFKINPTSPPRFGGSDQLVDMGALPRECTGVVFELQKSAYGSANVNEVALESWWTVGIRQAKVINVSESAVVLPTAAAADELFAQFSQQWHRCDGTTVTQYFASGVPFISAAISDVRATESVLAATVRTRLDPTDRSHIGVTVVHGRALGVKANCLVEVDVAYVDDHPDASPTKIAYQMMGNVSALT